LYGEETLKQVKEDSKVITSGLNESVEADYEIIFKPILTTPDSITELCIEANADENCAGIITWMHTFSPAKMWIKGLSLLKKPLLHLHTQFTRDIPWDSIDMDFMNLNQSAHGDREYGFIGARMKITRKVVVGYWKDEEVINKVSNWMDVAVAFSESMRLKIARFGDNMREVAVTEGDKVEAQIKFGWETNGYGVGELVKYVDEVTDAEIDKLVAELKENYEMPKDFESDDKVKDSIREQAKIEIAMRKFFNENEFSAFTTTFEDLHGLKQLPGMAVQRLMESGYGFGAEGDWKTSALLRVMKIMAGKGDKGTSFMEDYTYHFEPGNESVLGAHMLEVCPTVAEDKPKIEVHPLSIGGKEDPARIVFDGKVGKALNASLIDMGNRFRLIINEVESVKFENDMPNLPVARVLWKPEPSLKDAAHAWILAGGAHHTVFTMDVTTEQLQDWAEMVGIECVVINKDTKIDEFKKELKWNDLAWKL
jgi:L-arabinose isomerase